MIRRDLWAQFRKTTELVLLFSGVPGNPVSFPRTADFAGAIKGPLPGPSGVLARQQPAKSHTFAHRVCLF